MDKIFETNKFHDSTPTDFMIAHHGKDSVSIFQ